MLHPQAPLQLLLLLALLLLLLLLLVLLPPLLPLPHWCPFPKLNLLGPRPQRPRPLRPA